MHDTRGNRENRRYLRVRPAGLVSRTGKIIVDNKSPAMDCGIVDISAGGACLEVANPEKLPRRFVLFHGGTKKSCVIVWKSGRRFGVSF